MVFLSIEPSLFFYCSKSPLLIWMRIGNRPGMRSATGAVAMRSSFFRTVVFLAVTGIAASAVAAQRPLLLKRHGIVYGVRGINYGGCESYAREDSCTAYRLSGTILSITRNPDSHRIDGFVLRTTSGRRDMQNIDPAHFPAGAASLIRRGRRVRISGIRTGDGHVSVPNQIIAERR